MQGWDHSSWPALAPWEGAVRDSAGPRPGSPSPRTRHSPAAALGLAPPVASLWDTRVSLTTVSPLPGVQDQASRWAAYSFSCSGGSGDRLPPSWSWALWCLSRSRRPRSRAASSSSSRLHCEASLGTQRHGHPLAHSSHLLPKRASGGCLWGADGPGPFQASVSPSSRQRPWEVVEKLPSAGG